jgi:hypothetical protein
LSLVAAVEKINLDLVEEVAVMLLQLPKELEEEILQLQL